MLLVSCRYRQCELDILESGKFRINLHDMENYNKNLSFESKILSQVQIWCKNNRYKANLNFVLIRVELQMDLLRWNSLNFCIFCKKIHYYK